MQEINDRIAFGAVLIIPVRQVDADIIGELFFIQVVFILDPDHLPGMLVRGLENFPVIHEVVRGHARQIRQIQNSLSFLPADRAGAAEQT